MQNDDHAQAGQDTEGAVGITPGEGGAVAPNSSSGDPLDSIQDPDQLRAEAKKFRAIGKRHEKPNAEPVIPDKPAQNFLTVDAFHKTQTDAAKEIVKAQYPEIYDNWDSAITFAPSLDKSMATASDIVGAMRRGYAAWNVDRPSASQPSAKADLSTDAGVRGAAPKGAEPPKKDPLGLKQGAQPKDWY